MTNDECCITTDDYLYPTSTIIETLKITPKTWRVWCSKSGTKGKGNGKEHLYTVDDIYRVIRLVYGDLKAKEIVFDWPF
jgi:hypothetical protein